MKEIRKQETPRMNWETAVRLKTAFEKAGILYPPVCSGYYITGTECDHYHEWTFGDKWRKEQAGMAVEKSEAAMYNVPTPFVEEMADWIPLRVNEVGVSFPKLATKEGWAYVNFQNAGGFPTISEAFAGAIISFLEICPEEIRNHLYPIISQEEAQ